MAKKVEYYDNDTYTNVESEREYDVYSLTAIKERADQWDYDRGVTLLLYVDEQTGIVTTDVAAYEGSLK